MLHRRRYGLTGCCIPDSGSLIKTGSEHKATIRAEDGRPHDIIMVQWRRDGLAGCSIPDPRGFILAAGHHPPTIRTEHGAQHIAVVLQGWSQRRASVGIP